MKRIVATIVVLCVSFMSCVVVFASPVTAVEALAVRVLGKVGSSIEFRELPRDGEERFVVEGGEGKVRISGDTGSSLAMGLNWYLRYCCDVEFGWNSWDKPVVPEVLPVPEHSFSSKARVGTRFFLNYCTFGYTLPWWKWEDWEHLIDWMALNGVNYPLAITGQESVWYKVWTELGLSDEEVRAYFTGPAYLPWHRMQNIDRWQGPLPLSWLSGQEALQKRIVSRERELGMKPVLPAFSGHVPAAITRLYPRANVRSLGEWAGFDEPYHCCFLDPMDSLYGVIQGKFLKEQERLYGTDHIYGLDLFNEVTPPSWEPEYLSRVGKQVYESLKAVDSEAVWLQMTWLFSYQRKNWTNDRIEAYITSYPKERSVLLDYYCDSYEVSKVTSGFYGVPFVWCFLGNFGGNTMVRGDIGKLHTRFEDALGRSGGNLVGIGATLEGFDCNPFLYEYIFEKAWDYAEGLSEEKYSAHLAELRSGASASASSSGSDAPAAGDSASSACSGSSSSFSTGSAATVSSAASASSASKEAWDLIFNKLYTGKGHGRSIMVRRPALPVEKSSDDFNGYRNSDLKKAIELLCSVYNGSSTSDFDLVNFTRQYLVNVFHDEAFKYSEAFKRKDFNQLKASSRRMTEIMADLDNLLASDCFFLLGKWISDARDWGANEKEKDFFETNARNILSDRKSTRLNSSH